MCSLHNTNNTHTHTHTHTCAWNPMHDWHVCLSTLTPQLGNHRYHIFALSYRYGYTTPDCERINPTHPFRVKDHTSASRRSLWWYSLMFLVWMTNWWDTTEVNKTHFITLLRKEKDRLKNSSDCFIQFPIHFPVAYINKIIQRKKKKIKINDQYKLHINNFKSSSLMTLVHIYFITVEIGFQ